VRSVTQAVCNTLFGDGGAVGGNIDHLFRCQALDLPEYIAQAGPYPCLSYGQFTINRRLFFLSAFPAFFFAGSARFSSRSLIFASLSSYFWICL
jgi:hypothetical protein